MSVLKGIKGDKTIWAIVAILAVFSFMPVFSASSNLAWLGTGTGNTMKYLIKHAAHLVLGFTLLYFVHKLPYRYFIALSKLLLPVAVVLLLITMFSFSLKK